MMSSGIKVVSVISIKVFYEYKYEYLRLVSDPIPILVLVLGHHYIQFFTLRIEYIRSVKDVDFQNVLSSKSLVFFSNIILPLLKGHMRSKVL